MTHEEVFASSRHGALLLRSAVTDRQQQPFLSVTNPGRALLCDSALCPYEAVPHGDMMISGNLGLWRAHAAKDLTMATASEPSLLARSWLLIMAISESPMVCLRMACVMRERSCYGMSGPAFGE